MCYSYSPSDQKGKSSCWQSWKRLIIFVSILFHICWHSLYLYFSPSDQKGKSSCWQSREMLILWSFDAVNLLPPKSPSSWGHFLDIRVYMCVFRNWYLLIFDYSCWYLEGNHRDKLWWQMLNWISIFISWEYSLYLLALFFQFMLVFVEIVFVCCEH